MIDKIAGIREISLLIATNLAFLFVAVNVNPSLGTIYIGFTALTFFLYLFDPKRTIEIESRTDNRWMAIIYAMLGYIVLIFGGSFILSFLIPGITIKTVLGLLGTTAPALAQSKIVNFITFGILIAFIETQVLFVRLFDYIASRFNVEIHWRNLLNPKLLMIIISIGVLFVIYHLTAKGITNSAALLLVFIMALISLVMVAVFREGKQAILFHLTANSIASFYLLFGKSLFAGLGIG